MRGAECQIYHHLVQCKLNLYLKPNSKRSGIPRKRLKVNKKLLKDGFPVNFQEDHPIVPSPETLCQRITNSILQSSEESS
ncbi:hypothetical protein LOAG_15277, partial [Loa loa]